MGFKTIQVHVGTDAASDDRVAAAADFARRQDARLRGVLTLAPSELPGLDLGDGIEEARRVAARVAAPIEERFRAVASREGLRFDWIMEVGDEAEHLAVHARYADVVVLSQDRRESLWNDFSTNLPDHLPFAAGCPVLVLPPDRTAPVDASNILVAWKPTREAAAAVRAALPVLKEAATVTVITAGSRDETELHGAGILRFLGEHGVKASLRTPEAPEDSAGRSLLVEAGAVGAGLLVMGVYGHSRLRERILGGTSRHVLHHAEIPLLVAH
ncbi:MAG TPA: universal stress protein [Azospirillaceae bacterium]|nr:universal stress protein [Azospirillaceae bacterium]